MKNGSEIKVYLDGKVVASEQIAGARWYRYATFHSGSDFAAYDKRCYFSGQLDELTLYYKTLSDEEMARMAQKP